MRRRALFLSLVCVVLTSLLCVAPAPALAAPEDHSTMATAEKIDITTSESHSAYAPDASGDVWYTFSVPKTGSMHFSFSSAPREGASWEIGLYDASGELIYSPGAQDVSALGYGIPYLGYEAGTYYLRIRVTYGKQAESFIYTFQAHYSENPYEETERNNTPATADVMLLGNDLGGSTLSASDVDWYKITLEADENVQMLMNTSTIIVGGEPGAWDPGTGKWRVTLYDSPTAQADDVVATFDHDSADGTTLLETKRLAKGTYYVKVVPTEFVEFEDYRITMRTSADTVTMYRLYNQWSGEHFYTSDPSERLSLAKIGWTDEGVGWVGPNSEYGKPVYRLYNPYVAGGDHHYTMSLEEYNTLGSIGWIREGVGWYSGGEMPIYRQFNPYAITGTHNYTASAEERDALVRLGWRDEGVAWYGYSSS